MFGIKNSVVILTNNIDNIVLKNIWKYSKFLIDNTGSLLYNIIIICKDLKS